MITETAGLSSLMHRPRCKVGSRLGHGRKNSNQADYQAQEKSAEPSSLAKEVGNARSPHIIFI